MGYDLSAGCSLRGGFWRFFAAAAVCLACMIFSCLPVIAAPSPLPEGFSPSPQADAENAAFREVLEAIRYIERSHSLQTKIPDGSGSMRRENDNSVIKPPSVRFSEDVARIILYAGIAAIIVVVLVTLKDNLWSSSRSRRLMREEEITAPAETAVRMEKAKAEAEDLASSGSFAEAMHVLLLQSVNELRKRLDLSIAASLTSREILHRVSLPAAGKNAFAEVIGWVEISYFGFHEPTRDDYVSCRMSYETLAAELRKGPGESRPDSGGMRRNTGGAA